MPLIFGYIDPGSGSLFIQALIAGLVAIPIFFRSRIARGIRALRRVVSGDVSDPSTPSQDEAPPGS